MKERSGLEVEEERSDEGRSLLPAETEYLGKPVKTRGGRRVGAGGWERGGRGGETLQTFRGS